MAVVTVTVLLVMRVMAAQVIGDSECWMSHSQSRACLRACMIQARDRSTTQRAGSDAPQHSHAVAGEHRLLTLLPGGDWRQPGTSTCCLRARTARRHGLTFRGTQPLQTLPSRRDSPDLCFRSGPKGQR
ncbi:hypothetical protein ADL02_16795 [Streptomyces sp. NRRL WC-3723]|nr:hypothetical protein ADL02_16795 [Streptomyces sp. NRRL WC-3723]